jgi:MFS family permease
MIQVKYFTIIFISVAFFLFEGIQIASMNTLMPFIQNELKFNITSIGMISSTYFFTICIMFLPTGIILDKYGPWKTYPIAFSISAIGMFIFSFSSSLNVILISRFISGIGASFALLGGIKIVRSLFDINKAQFLTTLIIASHMYGDMLAQLPLTWLLNKIGWRNSLLIISLVAIFISIYSFFILCKLSQQENVIANIPKKITVKSIISIISNRIIWLSAFIVIMFELPILMLGTFFGHTFLINIYNVSELTSGSIFSLLYIILMISSIIFGYIWKKSSHNFILTIFFALLSLCAIISIFYIKSLMHNYPYIPFIFLAIGGSVQNAGYFFLVEHSDKQTLALCNSCMSLIIVFLTTLSRPLMAFIIEYKCHPYCNSKNLLMEDYERGGICLIICLLIGIISLSLAFARNRDQAL